MIATLVNKARKSPGKCTRCQKIIQAGDSYYWFKFRFGAKRIYCCDHPPRRSELTQSDKLSQLYAIQEAIEDGVITEFDSIADLADTLEQAASDVRNIGDEYRDSASNMENAFPGGSPTIDQCNESADSCDSWADELEQAAQNVRELVDSENQQEAVDEANSLAEEAANTLEL